MDNYHLDYKFPEVDTRSLPAVRKAVLEIYLSTFPLGTPLVLDSAFSWAEACFAGRYGDYQPIDAKYHDLEHTLQGTLCFARLLEGYKKAKAKPELTQRIFELGIIAILLHDTGYLKKRGDREGTGAKYTLVHVSRSSDFAAFLLREKGFPAEEIRAVQNMIRCTGVNANLASIPFQTELEQRVGFALGTSDLLGQMAADDYVDKLDTLYLEFEESNQYNNRVSGPGVFTSAEDLRKKTPAFWESYVRPKIANDFLGLYQYLSRPIPGGENEYHDKIRANIARLKRELSTALA
jgi:hypothetical protein